jgi:CheY-like chemotaxis protein
MNTPIQILIIDDDPAVRFLTRYSLEKFVPPIPFKIKEAKNGLQGLEYISTASFLPDVIFLDIQMPVMNGFDFLKTYEKLTFPQGYQSAIYILSNMISDDITTILIAGRNIVKGVFEKPLTDDHIEMVLSSLSLQGI